jgi:thiosulfate dehydrogenase [quinone] large subunit
MLQTAPHWYAQFLQTVVLPNLTAFSVMVEWGETLVGISLLLGLFSRVGAVGGLFLVTNYFLGNGTGALHDAWFGFDVTTFMMTSVRAILPTGRIFGLDAILLSRRAK